MHLSNALAEVRAQLRRNLWQLINSQQLEYFKFGEHLEKILVGSGTKIVAHPLEMLVKYADKLYLEYGQILDYLQQNVADGDIIALEQYVKDKVNGSFTNLIKDFLDEYESYKNDND